VPYLESWEVSRIWSSKLKKSCIYLLSNSYVSRSEPKQNLSFVSWAGREDDSWWVFPGLLLLVKCMQAQMIDSHIANLEIQDATLYSADPTVFWES
jgi:hypothetical protein